MTPTFEKFKKGAKLFYLGALKIQYTAKVDSNKFGVFQTSVNYTQDGRKKKQYFIFQEHELLNYYQNCMLKMEELV